MKPLNHLYVIGDIQGCCDPLNQLHAMILKEDSKAQLLILGDVVSRGPKSLETLRKLMALGERANTVLGNHDLALLCTAYTGCTLPDEASLRPILDAPDREALLDWLRHRPLALNIDNHLIVHAGVLPSWSVQQTLAYAQEVESILQGKNYVDFLEGMYGNEPSQWSPQLTGMDRLRCIVNVLTRLRFCTADDRMEFESKESLAKTPDGYAAWFDLRRQTENSTVIFGHWAMLGLLVRSNVIGLDTGCVWGGKLTAMRLSDRRLFQVSC
jgi:bis(5'-nucleosyl)-tetraphosphatase (symmetrical)